MPRFAPITDPTKHVNVTTTITQKHREELRSLAFAKEGLPVRALLTVLIQRYLNENADLLKTLSVFRGEPEGSPVNPTDPAEDLTVS